MHERTWFLSLNKKLCGNLVTVCLSLEGAVGGEGASNISITIQFFISIGIKNNIC